MQNLGIDKQLLIFIDEAIDKRIIVALLFLMVSTAVLTIGIFWPKVYESSTKILWNKSDSLSPLLSDNIAKSTVSEQADIARELILGNKILNALIEKTQMDIKQQGGGKLSKRSLEVLKAELRSSISVKNRGQRLIQISYRNKNPELAYLVVKILAELFLSESREMKNLSSKDAYDFIERQVNDYKFKLDSINQQIIDFKKKNIDLESDSSLGVSARVNNLKSSIRQSKLELTEANVQKNSLLEQLALEENKMSVVSAKSSSRQRESAYTERLNLLISNLDTLRLSYTESYPDIVQIKGQIKKLKELIEEENDTQLDQADSNKAADSEENIKSALYINLRNDLANIETRIKTLEARIFDNTQRLENELLRSSNVIALETKLNQMTRDLDVTKGIYNDLLNRRENARVSLNLQLENQGSTFKIQEPATIPTLPKGLRFMHFAMGSIILGFGIPLGLVFGLLIIDPRIRHEDSIDKNDFNIPVLGVVEGYRNDTDILSETVKTRGAIFVLIIAGIVLSILTSLKWFQVIGS